MAQRWSGLRGTLSDTDLRLLRVFLTVVAEGGLAASELALDKSVSAISLDITKLERRMGATLCTRGTAGFSLTGEGRILHNAARQLFADIDRFRARLGDGARGMTGQVTLALLDNLVSVAEPQMRAALGAFRGDWPEVVPVVESGPAPAVAGAVLKGRAEIGIAPMPRPVESLDALPLFAEDLRLYCGPGHPLFGVARPAAAEVRSHRLILPSIRHDPGFDGAFGGFPPGARADTLDGRVLLLLSGCELGFLPPDFAAPWVARGALQAVRPDLFATRNRVHLITRRGATRSSAAEALVAALLTAFGPGQGPGRLPEGGRA